MSTDSMRDPVATASRGKRNATHPALRAVQLGFSLMGHVTPRLTGALAYRMVFRPRRSRGKERGKQMLDQATSQSSFSRKGKAVVSYIWGDSGPSVLLVHGWESNAGRFASLISHLREAGYRVVAFDAPGHGRSQGQESDILEFVHCIRTLAEEHGPLAAAVGHSFGGMALTYALRHGVQADKVVLVSAPSRFDGLKDKLRALLAVPPKVVDDFSVRVEQRFADHTDEVWEHFSPAINARDIRIPALIVHDQDDREVPVAEGEELHRAWQGSQMVQIQGVGHHRILQDESVLAQVISFLGSENPTAGES